MGLHLDKEKINDDLKGAKDLKNALKTLKQHTATCNKFGKLLIKECTSKGINYYYYNIATSTFSENISLSTTSTKGSNGKAELFNKSDFKTLFSDTLVVLDSFSLKIGPSVNLPLNNYVIIHDSSKIELGLPTFQNSIRITSNIVKTGNYEKIILRNKSLSPTSNLGICNMYLIDNKEEKTITTVLNDMISANNIPKDMQYNFCLGFILNMYGKPAQSTIDKLFEKVSNQ